MEIQNKITSFEINTNDAQASKLISIDNSLLNNNYNHNEINGLKISFLCKLKKELDSKNIIKSENFNEKILEDYNVIGFDVDHTLETYNMHTFSSHLYSCFSKYLVDYKFYPVNLNIFDENIEKQNLAHPKLNFLSVKNFHNYACTEVLLDLEHGNACKIADDLTVLKAFHGLKELTKEEINQIYEEGKYPTKKNFNYHRSYNENYFYIRGYIEFHISALFLFSVELFDLNFLPGKGSYKSIFEDIFEGLGFNYKLNEQSSDSFQLAGYYYPEMFANTKVYLNKEVNSNQKLRVRNTLENLKNKGKKLFFATNSFYYYADIIMRNSLGEDYNNLFDLSFYFAKKPAFFKAENDNHFMFINDKRKYYLDDLNSEDIFQRVKNEKILLGGSFRIVEAFFNKLQSKENIEKVLYIGDNFSNDCASPTYNKGWDTIAVDESLETGFIGKRNESLCCKWKMDFSEEIKEYRFKVIRESVKLAITNVQTLDQFL